jgi:hypothetical protein
MNRSFGALLGILVLVIGGWVTYRRYESNQLSPFRMWDNRAGATFFFFDSEAYHDTGKRFRCRSVEGEVQLCEIETGVAGRMRLALDNSGRAMIVQWQVADSSLRMVEEARKMAAEWSLVESRHSQRKGVNGTSRTRWLTVDSAWSASMSDDFSNTANPRSIEIVDERRLRRVEDGSAPALLRLAQTGYIDADELDAAVTRAPDAMAAAASALGARGRALAVAAASLPHCDFQPGDSVVAGNDLRSEYGIDNAKLLEQAMAQAYPGMRLLLGHHAYLVNAAGAAEEIRVLAPTTDGDAFAFAVNFPKRAEAVDRRLVTFGDTTGQCRASAEIIVARRDSATGQVMDVRRGDADEDAMASQVRTLDFARDEDASPLLVVKYTATYGTATWIGEVDWDAVVAPVGGAPRVTRRLPNALGWKDNEQHETAGMAMVEKTSPAGLHMLMAFTTAESPTRFILPLGPRGVPSGWMLLDLLQ